MSLRLLICPLLFLSLLSAGVQAQADVPHRERDGQQRSAQISSTPQDDVRQQRRAGLRQELRTQNAENAPALQRQLSPQDRADLRQQLRQQRRENPQR